MQGRVLDGRYRIIAAIGQGGMGTVYEAEEVSSGGRVAVKVLKPEHAEKPEAVARLRHEAQIAGGLRHENICAVFDVGILDDASPYVVMERLHGETLASRLSRTGPVPPNELVEIMLQVLEGLRAAHARKVLHRDMKPDNIFLVEAAGRVVAKVVDFGISKGMGDEKAHHLTRTGMVMGTPYYMSPEQAMGERDLDGRVDVWGSGVAIYEALTGIRPFVAKNYNALLVQILTAIPKPLEELRPDVPRGLAEVVRHALEKRREKRFGSVVELRSALVPFRTIVVARPAPSRAGIGLPKVPMFTGGEDYSSTTSDDEPTLEMARDALPQHLQPEPIQPEPAQPETDPELTEVDDPPSFADSDHALTERRRR
ncbi:MAG: serine/threonine protein kinase [Polyangiaceae bacterium]|nr:serine/threonine protein kinase [Polyangiaceae bacterium]